MTTNGFQISSSPNPKATPSLFSKKHIEMAHGDVATVLRSLDSDLEGLSSIESSIRLQKYGLNEIAREKPLPWYVQLLKTFQNPLAILITLHPRNPKQKEIPIQFLVPGDVIYLSAGDMIPADVRLIAAKDLFVSQGALTGESLPVEKQDVLPESVISSNNPLEFANLCFMGTAVYALYWTDAVSQDVVYQEVRL